MEDKYVARKTSMLPKKNILLLKTSMLPEKQVYTALDLEENQI